MSFSKGPVSQSSTKDLVDFLQNTIEKNNQEKINLDTRRASQDKELEKVIKRHTTREIINKMQHKYETTPPLPIAKEKKPTEDIEVGSPDSGDVAHHIKIIGLLSYFQNNSNRKNLIQSQPDNKLTNTDQSIKLRMSSSMSRSKM